MPTFKDSLLLDVAETAKPASDLKLGSVQLRFCRLKWTCRTLQTCRRTLQHLFVHVLDAFYMGVIRWFVCKCPISNTAVESINSQLWQLKEVGCAQHWNLNGPRFPKSWCAAGCEPASHESKDIHRYLTISTVECCYFMMNYTAYTWQRHMNHNRWFAYLYHLLVEVEPKSWKCLHVIYLPMT